MATVDLSVLTGEVDEPAFELHRAERVDVTEQIALICVTGTLDALGRAKPPQLIIMGTGRTESVPPTSHGSRAPSSTDGPHAWRGEYAVSSQTIADPASTLHLLPAGGRLVDLPALSAPSRRVDPPSTARGPRRRRLFLTVGVIVGAAGFATLGYVVGHADRTPSDSARATRPAQAIATTPVPRDASRFIDDVLTGATRRFPLTSPYPHPPSYVVPPRGTTLVAHAQVPRVAVFPSAGAAMPTRFLLNPNGSGSPAAFLVKGQDEGRIEVALPTRPNGSTGWVNAGDLALSINPFRLDIDLTGHALTLSRYDKLVERDRIGVGKSLTPTPSGTYFVTALLKLTDPAGIYGPYAFATSAHSTILNEFAGGNGRIGIHGTNQPEAIGNSISHGCIRVFNSTIERLAKVVPLGTPVTIHR